MTKKIRYLRCDVDLYEFLMSFLEKRKKKNGEPMLLKVPKNPAIWYKEFAGIRNACKVDAPYIAGMIRWCFERSDFWGSVVASPNGLRKNFEKIDLQMQKPKALSTFEKKRSAVDDYHQDTVDPIVSHGTLSKDQFSIGIKVLLSCGGPNIDTQTLGVWHTMLADLTPEFYDKAIYHICQTEESPQTLNIVQKIREVHNVLRKDGNRLKLLESPRAVTLAEEYKAHPERFCNAEESREQLRLLTKAIGNI